MPNRAATGFAADYLREVPVFGWFMSAMLQSIFVKRGAGDLEAIGRAVDVLERGEALVIAPEGTRSRDGILRTPKTGVAWIALQSGVPVIPVAAFGHEHPERHWKRLRRPVVTIRVGAALKETPRDNTPSELSGYTNLVMRELASLLPEQYRGIYGRDVAASHGHHR
jgi:1-acyl-sn-glycerol-3-phosphate acyltransferase